MSSAREVDVVVIGAGAAGMMCALTAGRRGRRVLLLEHARWAGEKIRISGGGRCNFTNLRCTRDDFLSDNPHFCRSALAGYTPQDFIALVDTHGIAWHEKTLGQLFCDGPATQVVDLLLAECAAAGVRLELATPVTRVARATEGFALDTRHGTFIAARLVIATGGRSIPKIGASGFAYAIAEQFGVPLVPTRPGLVPLMFEDALRRELAPLAGVSLEVEARCGRTAFREALLFTHRGLSGPAVLQISSYWPPGTPIVLDLAPDLDVYAALRAARASHPRQHAVTVLAEHLPRRLALRLVEVSDCARGHLAELSDARLRALDAAVKRWQVLPAGSEGYRKAEVTVGGVATDALSSRDLEVRAVPGLHFIGEAVDVTGHLGGFNFQWAWSSGHAAGMAV